MFGFTPSLAFIDIFITFMSWLRIRGWKATIEDWLAGV